MMKFFTLLLAIFAFNAIEAQTVIWGGPGDANGEFDGGLNDWTVDAISDPDALWVWEADATADQGAYFGDRPPIASNSVANGAACFDSDFYDNEGIEGNFGMGVAPATQNSALISPVFSTVGFDNVSIQWTQYMRQFQSTFDLEVTTDGGTSWTTFPIDANNSVAVNSETATDDFIIINVSSAAANAAEVQFRFSYTSNYYYWVIDDVAVIETPAIDMKMTNMYYPLQGYQIPQSIIGADTLEFGVEITNQGSEDNAGGNITAVISDSDGVEVYSFTEPSPAVAVGDTAFVVFQDVILPADISFDQEEYSIIYEVTSDAGEDFVPANNGMGEFFEITDEYFATNNGITGANNFNGGDFTSAIVVRTADAGTNMQYLANSIISGGAANGGNGVENADYTVFVFKVENQVSDELDPIFEFENFGDDDDEHPNLTFVGFSDFQVIAGENFTENVSDLFNEEADLGIVLDNNSTYMFCVRWDFENNPGGTIFQNSSTSIFYYQITSLAFFPDDSQGLRWYGLEQSDLAWGIGPNITVEQTIATEQVTLDENVVTVYPNPAADFTSVNLDFQEVTNATIILRDMRGSYITSKSVKNVKNEKVEFDLSNYPSGNYSFEIKTSNGGVSVKSFVITK